MSFSLLDTLVQKCLSINKLIVTFTDKKYYIPYESWTLKYTLPYNADPNLTKTESTTEKHENIS